MRITGQFVRVALASAGLLPTLISALTVTEQEVLSREYAAATVKNNIVHFFGGSSKHLEVVFLNATGGLDASNPTWNWWNKPPGTTLQPFVRGVAFNGNDDYVFLQGGSGSTSIMEGLIKFHNNNWQQATPIGSRPATSFMTANLNPLDNSVYYYGGRLLKNHEIDVTKQSLNSFYRFDVTKETWTLLSPLSTAVERPGRTSHSSNLINNQVFIMGGVSDFASSSKPSVSADFASVLVYDIKSNTALSVTTLGDIPAARQSYSTALGLDGHSIVLYGGYFYDGSNKLNLAPSDVYVLDTCTLTWRKQETKGSAPGQIYAHNAVNINNYMVVALGKTSEKNFNFKLGILDLSQWKWVNTLSETKDTIQAPSCSFELPAADSLAFVAMNYDESVLKNPLTPEEKKKVDGKGFGIGFGILAVILIAGGIWFYLKRYRNKRSRTLNPRWMRNVPSHTNNGYSNDRDYPLFVYNKELDNDNLNNPNIPRSPSAFAPNGVRTYTASDHEQWEQQLNDDAANPNGSATMSRNSDIWKRMRGLNDASVISDEEVQQNRNNNGRLVDL